MAKIRRLSIVLGDQLNHDSALFDDFDPRHDRIWMAENQEEATHVWCHRYRLVAFFSPMRHFRDELQEAGRRVEYHELPVDGRKAKTSSFASLLRDFLDEHQVERIAVVRPGDYRVQGQLQCVAQATGVELDILADRHDYCPPEEFAQWAEGRKSLVLDQFYRSMRTKHDVLVNEDGKPVGGEWNYDSQNRETFGNRGPQEVPHSLTFPPDDITREVIAMVEKRFADHPGSTDRFNLPVTRSDALKLMEDFMQHRLRDFGRFQDAMWHDETFLFHSRLSNAINLHLLSPREVVESAVAAFREDLAPLNSAEGFVRQILGWREYVRGVYWLKMPEYAELNALGCDEDQGVPSYFWDGKTEMACVRDAMRLLLDTAYAHHIQRLMVLGLFAQLYGVHPHRFHEWHMAMYADAIDWVSLPNALGMSQYGDGGIVGTKPYCASGNYIHRMSNHCRGCRYKYNEASGDDACPFTTLYWDFLDRHRQSLADNHRMAMQLKNLSRKKPTEMKAIRARAAAIRSGMDI